MSLQKTLGKNDSFKHPTTTVSQSRLPVFAPVTRVAPQKANRPVKNITFTTPYGSCTVKKCRLTQIHRDIIDAILNNHIKAYHDPGSGNVTYFINPYQIMKFMGKKDRDRTDWLKAKIEDLQSTIIVVRELNWEVRVGIVLRQAYEIETTEKFGGGLYMVEFSGEYLRVFERELNVHYPKLVSQIAQIDSALVKATVRFFLTHRDNKRIGVDKLLATLGIDRAEMNERSYREKVKELKDNHSILESFGIIQAGDCYTYPKQNTNVWFSDPVEVDTNDPEAKCGEDEPDLPVHS